MPTAPPNPDLWVRVHSNGSWWPSSVPPLSPHEQPGSVGFRCPECGSAFRTIEGGPLGH